MQSIYHKIKTSCLRLQQDSDGSRVAGTPALCKRSTAYHRVIDPSVVIATTFSDRSSGSFFLADSRGSRLKKQTSRHALNVVTTPDEIDLCLVFLY